MITKTASRSSMRTEAWLSPSGSQGTPHVDAVQPSGGGSWSLWNGTTLVTTTALLAAVQPLSAHVHAQGRVPRHVPLAQAGLRESRAASPTATTPSQLPLLANEQLHAIDEYLDIPVTRVATIVGASRQSLYAWRRRDTPHPTNTTQAERLAALAALAHEWHEMAFAPLGKLVTLPVGERRTSLFDLLSATHWDRPAIRATLVELAEVLARSAGTAASEFRPRSPQQMATDRAALRLAFQ